MTGMLECEKCGNGLVPGDLKCKICGHFSGRACGACTRHVPSGKRICDVCGFDLGPEFPFSSLSAPQDEGAVKTQGADLPEPAPSPESPADVPDHPVAAQKVLVGYDTAPPVRGGQTRPLPERETPVVSDEEPLSAGQARNGSPQRDASPEQLPVVPPVPVPSRPPPVTRSPPPAIPATDREPVRLDHTDYHHVLDTCRDLVARRTDLYGVFGRPASGKTVFIYALGKLLKGGHGDLPGVGHYSLGRNWEDLLRHQESLFASGIEKPTARGLHFYKADAIGSLRRKRHFALVDIPGEQFEQIEDWTREITDFFLTYLTHCKGFFLFLELDPDTVSTSPADVLERWARKKGAPLDPAEAESFRQAWMFKRNQLHQMVRFLSVAATVGKVADGVAFEQQRSALNTAQRETAFGGKRIHVPVVLCISKADLIKDYRFDGFPPIVPGSDGPLGNPWHAVDTFFPKELAAMKQLVPRLKVEWVSSTGENFNAARGIGRPLGMVGAFKHVVSHPPPSWSLSSAAYQRFARLFGLEAG